MHTLGNANYLTPWYPQEVSLVVSMLLDWFSVIKNPIDLRAEDLTYSSDSMILSETTGSPFPR